MNGTTKVVNTLGTFDIADGSYQSELLKTLITEDINKLTEVNLQIKDLLVQKIEEDNNDNT